MLKNIFKTFGQAVVLISFVMMIAACYSSKEAVELRNGLNSSSDADHAEMIELPCDTTAFSDLASN